MKKLFTLIAFVACVCAFNANAITLEEKLAKVETSYTKRIDKIDSMKRASAEKKEILKKHAKENYDLKVKQTKELDKLNKPVKVSKKVAKRSTKKSV